MSEPSLTEVALFAENFLLVRPGEDEGTPVPSRETLREMRLLLLEEGHCFRDQALSFCKMQSSPPREILDASSLSTLVQMVSAGIGVTLIPEMAVAVETRSASGVRRPLQEPATRRGPSAWSGARPVRWRDSCCRSRKWSVWPPASRARRDRLRAIQRHEKGRAGARSYFDTLTKGYRRSTALFAARRSAISAD